MLAGAIVVGGIRLLPGADHGAHRGLVIGQMGAAFEIGGGEPDAGQPGAHRLDMARLAAVGGAGERDLGLAQLEFIGGPGLDQGQGQQAA